MVNCLNGAKKMFPSDSDAFLLITKILTENRIFTRNHFDKYLIAKQLKTIQITVQN